MPLYDIACPSCGARSEVITAWDNRQVRCSCGALTERVWSASAVISDSIIGGQIIENLGHEPMTFYSKKAIVEEANRRGLRLRDQWAGPGDQHLTNWAASISAQHLQDAAVLVARGSRPAPTNPETVLQSFKGSQRIVKQWSDIE